MDVIRAIICLNYGNSSDINFSDFDVLNVILEIETHWNISEIFHSSFYKR